MPLLLLKTAKFAPRRSSRRMEKTPRRGVFAPNATLNFEMELFGVD
jgi:hypothetical protein